MIPLTSTQSTLLHSEHYLDPIDQYTVNTATQQMLHYVDPIDQSMVNSTQ